MDPNTITNTGTDAGVWISALLAWVLGALAVYGTVVLAKRWIRAAKEKHEHADQAFVKVLITTFVTIALFATGFWVLFGAYGPGDPVVLPTAEQDGFHKILEEAPEEPTLEEKEQLGSKKLPAILKEVQRNAANDGGTEDDYIRKAVERANRLQGGNE